MQNASHLGSSNHDLPVLILDLSDASAVYALMKHLFRKYAHVGISEPIPEQPLAAAAIELVFIADMTQTIKHRYLHHSKLDLQLRNMYIA